LQGKVATPADPAAAVALAQQLVALRGPPTLQGADEGPRLERAAEIVREVLAQVPDAARPVAARVLWSAGFYEAAASLGGPLELAAMAVAANAPQELLAQIAKVETDDERRQMLDLHRAWAAQAEAAAASRPLERSSHPLRERLRLGFLSSDLRVHVVGYFVQPLFEFIDPRFELFIYRSGAEPADDIQRWFEARATGVRALPADDRAAAQAIADDDLDLLIDLAGPTSLGRPALLAYKPTRRQAAWLGYPHSLGLRATDFYIADPFLAPAEPELIAETPLLMPASFICMAPAAFQPQPPVVEPGPAQRNGHVTFGVTNDPYKFTPRAVRAWGEAMAATPGSRLLIVRPEAGVRAFQRNISALLAQGGADPARVEFRALRGAVRLAYADIDVALDTFPVTGGTTTCEAAWMGTPTVSLVGPAPYERLSYSILSNLALGDLCAENVDEYVRIAGELGRAPERIAELRASLRARVRAGALGAAARFARDFYATLAEAVGPQAA
jgi:predicted O-linked N-acetylglucosamine transferase (SPINDLY family)